MPGKRTPTTSIGADAVQAKTGKNWAEWFALLDAAGAESLTHQEIVALLSTQYAVGPWWRQMVTVTYEQARGRRAKHETPAGFQMSASKTVAAPVERLYRAFADARSRARWLPDSGFQVRTAVPPRRIRFSSPDGRSVIAVGFTAQGDDKSRVVVGQTRLPNAAAVKRQKAYWGAALDVLKAQLERKV